jgi:predicted metal-dependent phosphoesterase TrpH
MYTGIDLHTHTDASDGALSREELIRTAKANRVRIIAISDHDTMKNAGNGEEDGIYVVPAVELSARDGKTGRRVHVLCYFPREMSGLEEYFSYMSRSRKEAGDKYIENVSKIFPEITPGAIEPYCRVSGTIFKSYIMDELIKLGYTVEPYGSLYKRLFGKESPNRDVGVIYADVKEVVGIARRSGGAVVIAHPTVYSSMEITEELAREGLIDGIEIDHPRNSEADRARLIEICREKNLIVTGGTDYHGINSGTTVHPGMFGTEMSELKRLARKAGQEDAFPEL